MRRICSSSWCHNDHQTDELDPRPVERVRITASHDPLFGQLVRVVRRKRHNGEPQLVIEGPDGGRQVLPARHVEGAAPLPSAAAPAPTFTPGSLRALASLVAGLRNAPFPAPEARHAPAPSDPTPPGVEHLPARDPPAHGGPLGRPRAAPASPRAGTRARARKAVP